MKNFNKKLVAIILVLIIALISIFAINKLLPNGEVGDKTLYFTLINEIEDSPETIYENREIKTSQENLGAVLNEQTEELQVTIGCDASEYGRCLEGMGGLNGDLSSASGPWILYESDNNELCLNAGYCPGIDDLTIADGDSFTFRYTDSYE